MLDDHSHQSRKVRTLHQRPRCNAIIRVIREIRGWSLKFFKYNRMPSACIGVICGRLPLTQYQLYENDELSADIADFRRC